MSNKALWDRVFTTDPRAVKPITGKQYKGNSPKPYWIVERLTDEFGPCGIGWGFAIVTERMERMTETDVLHIAAIKFWYMLDGQRGEVEQIGQTKAAYKTASGSLLVDEDAPKKSVTDALVKCASYLGFAGDIFSGRWDDSKYVAAADAEWKARRFAQDPERANWLESQKDAIFSAKTSGELKEVVALAVDIARSEDDTAAVDLLKGWAQEKIKQAKTKEAA